MIKRKRTLRLLPLLLCLCLLVPGGAMATCSVCPCACASGSSCGGGLSCPSNAPAPAQATGGDPATGLEPGYNPNTPYANFPYKKMYGYVLEKPNRPTGCILLNLIPLYGGALFLDGQQVLFAQRVVKDELRGTILQLIPSASYGGLVGRDLNLYLDANTNRWLLDRDIDTVGFGALDNLTLVDLEELEDIFNLSLYQNALTLQTTLTGLARNTDRGFIENLTVGLLKEQGYTEAQADELSEAFEAVFGVHPSAANGDDAFKRLDRWLKLITPLNQLSKTEVEEGSIPASLAGLSKESLIQWRMTNFRTSDQASFGTDFSILDRHVIQFDQTVLSAIIPAETGALLSTANIVRQDGLSGTAADIARAARDKTQEEPGPLYDLSIGFQRTPTDPRLSVLLFDKGQPGIVLSARIGADGSIEYGEYAVDTSVKNTSKNKFTVATRFSDGQYMKDDALSSGFWSKYVKLKYDY